jgi:hypothetical protein
MEEMDHALTSPGPARRAAAAATPPRPAVRPGAHHG